MSSTKDEKLSYGELTDLVLEAIANGLIEMKWGYKPRLPVVLGLILKYILEIKRKKISKEKIQRKLKNLEQRDILEIEEKNNDVYISLKNKGEKKIVKYSLQLLLDYKKREKRWDGKWFLVFFDVPEIQRNKRDYLRKLLKQLGFYQYQQSVYLFPYACDKEVVFIKKIVEGARYMKYIIAERIEDEELACRHFHIRK